jgi:hypothetical protein
MWYMHDVAPAHFSIQECNHLNNAYPGRRIGRCNPVVWPAQSPDLNPLDFFVWGHLKTLVYETTVEKEADLLPRIQDACDDIRHIHCIFERTSESMMRRCMLCSQMVLNCYL